MFFCGKVGSVDDRDVISEANIPTRRVPLRFAAAIVRLGNEVDIKSLSVLSNSDGRPDYSPLDKQLHCKRTGLVILRTEAS